MSDTDLQLRLIEAAKNEAGLRLAAVRADINSGVGEFNSKAHDATENLKGKSDSDTGITLFNVLLDVAVAAIPGAEHAAEAMKILEEVGKEAAKGFAEAFADGVHKAAAESAADRLADAKAELRRIATKLLVEADASARAAFNKAEDLLGHSASQALAHHPELGVLHEVTADAIDQAGKKIAVEMGLPAPGENRIADRITSGLMTEFESEYARVKKELDFQDLDSEDDQIDYLLNTVGRDNIDAFLTGLGESHDEIQAWKYRIAEREGTLGAGAGSESELE